MALKLITAPTIEPISLAQAKQHLRVDHTDDDAYIQTAILAARYIVDGMNGYLGRALVTQTWEYLLDAFPADRADEIKIPLPPLQSVVSVKYDDANGTEQTIAPTAYDVDTASEPGRILAAPSAASWPTVFAGLGSVRIRFIAGYPATSDSPPDLTVNVPFDIKAAMLLYIGTLYNSRESIVVGTNSMPLPQASEILLRRYRVLLGIA